MTIRGGREVCSYGTCLASGGEMLSFYESGKLKTREMLAANTTVGGVRYKRGTNMGFYESGKVNWGTLAAPATIRGTRYASGTFVEFDEDGAVKDTR